MRKLGPLMDPTIIDGGRVILRGDATGPSDANVVEKLAGLAGVVTLVSRTTIQQTQPPAAVVQVEGTADITAGALYGGGGTLNGLTLRMSVDQQGLSTLVFNGATNALDEAHLLAAIIAKVAGAGIGAMQGGTGGNKLDLSAPISITIDAASTALAALGLSAGTYAFAPAAEVALRIVAANGDTWETGLASSQGNLAHEIDNQWHSGINALNQDPAKPGAGFVIEQLFNGNFEEYQQSHGVGFANATRWYSYNYNVGTGINSLSLQSQVIDIGQFTGGAQDTTNLNTTASVHTRNVGAVQLDLSTIAGGVTASTTVGVALTSYSIIAGVAGQKVQIESTGGGGAAINLYAIGGSITTTGNLQLGSLTGAFGSGTTVVGVTDASVVPTTNPSGGGILYSTGGQGAWRRSDGTVIGFG